MLALLTLTLTLLAGLVTTGQARTVQDNGRHHWRTDTWGSCYVERGCGEGQRERKVWCQDTHQGKAVTLYHCRPQDEPPRTKPCFVACRHHKDHLEWRVGDWGPCLAADTELSKMGAGSMERNVTCVLTSHEGFQNSLQIDEENCMVVSTRPESQRDCTLPTQQDCVLTEWAAWTACCDGTQHRTRSVLVAPHYGGQECPQLSEWRPCEVEDNSVDGPGLGCAPHTEGVRLRVERWGECRAAPHRVWDGESGDRADNYYKHWPQVGTQRRDFTCLNVNGTTVPLSSCTKEKGESSLPPRERACILAQDCSVSEWSDWTVIQAGCVDATGNVWAEITERRREVLRLHEGQGQPCPHLVETKSTTSNLPLCSHRYRWLASKWSACTLPNVMDEVVCGGGLQFRNITCVAAQGGQPLPTKACHTIPPPPTVQRCEVACPRDCEVGPWAPWGPCLPLHCPPSDEANISNKGHRKRSRAVVVPPSALGLECPSLTEVQPCAHPACYAWTVDAWGACQLEPGTGAKCGTGRRSRRVACTTHSDGTDFKEVVADWLCAQLKPPTEEPCLLPCPYDCVVSGWSAWSPCSQSCSTRNNMAMRHRNRTIIAPHGPGGHPCPDPDEMLQMDGCNSHGCHGYSWLTLPWQPCNASCDSGEGMQLREVWCVQDNQDMVNESKCELLPKPVTARSCVQDCPAQCEVSPWSEWSPCPPHNCQPNGTRAAATQQSRYRVVVEGADCGPLEETRECFTPTEPCPRHSWATGQWSPCQLAHDVRCGHGLRTRDLWCSEEETERKAELRQCLAARAALPATVQRCHVDCHMPCQLTEWSPWSLCLQPCSGIRTRTRQLIGLSEGHSVCQEMPLLETKPCPCEMFYPRPISNWSSCLTNGSAGCGFGTRYRAVGCYNDRDQMVDPSLCGGGTGLQEEPCMVTCPEDCQLTEWTAWEQCNVHCGPGLQNRTRKVAHPGNAGGRQCGPLTQWKLCQVPCEVFQWQAGGWSECILIPADRKQGCGTGDQYRQVRCMDTRSDTPVDDEYCDWTTQPVDINACHVACPGDCVLSAWSDWSSCPKGCIGNGQQQRTRSLLRAAATRGATCQHTIQTQACQLNITCFTYHWVVTNFSSCLPLGGSPCGEGMTTRAIYCQRSDSRPVEDSWCSEETKPTPAEKWCYVDCPVDCHVAEWSEWNATQCHCGETGVSRHAFISTNPSSSGRPCPSPLVQWKPCPAVPCYSWQTGPWSDCQLHGATCGHGVRNRNVTCVRGGDNTTVEAWHCSGAASRKPVSWETCHVPCDTDCQLSDWSHWSHCHGDCLKDTTGYATRSRAVLRPPQSNGGEPCPEALWETRTCDLGPCLTFSWTIAPNGQIVCQRSDGLHVVGGCDGKRKPTLCEWKGGRCNCIDGAVVQPQFACLEQAQQVQARLYFPKDDDLNVWMFAMIGIGCVFIVFVAASIFLLCKTGRQSSGHAK